MYVSSSQIRVSKVFDAEGQPVGQLSRVIIDPDNGQILAFELHKHNPKFLSPHDLVSWKTSYLTLGQHFEFHLAEDLVRLHKVLHSPYSHDLIGRQVYTESGTFVGIVMDYSIHTDYKVLASLTTQKSLFGLWNYDTRLIHQSMIREIKPRRIIVRDSLLKLPARQNSPEEFDLQKSPTFDRALSSPEDRTCS